MEAPGDDLFLHYASPLLGLLSPDSQPTMDPLAHLPPELILEVIAHVPLRSLPALRCASREWNALIGAHEDVIFRHVAQEELRVHAPCERPDKRHRDWKAVCESFIFL